MSLITLSTAYLRFNDILTTPSSDLQFLELMIADGKICFGVNIYPTITIDGIEKHNVLNFTYIKGSSSVVITVYTQEDGWIYDGFKNFRVVKYQEPTDPTYSDYDIFLNWINQNVTVIEQTGEIQKIKFSSSQPFTLSTPNGEPTWSQIAAGAAQQQFGQVYMIANDSRWDGTTVISSELKDGIYVITLYCIVQENTGNIAINAKLQGLTLTGNNIKVEGNISSLILSPGSKVDKVNPQVFVNYVKLGVGGAISSMFQNMFANNTSITDVSDLICDVITNTQAYMYAFQACSNLLNPPQLPVKYLLGVDYGAMFQNCTSLAEAPELPSTTLANQCYQLMFAGCTSLTAVPELLATTLKNNCYRQMFSGCTSLKTLPELPATTLANNCYREMFYGCTSLKTLPELPALTMPSYCYNGMFNGCTGIKLSTTQVDNYTQAYRIPVSGTGTLGNANAVTNMFANTGGTFAGTPTINTVYYLWTEPQTLSKIYLNKSNVSFGNNVQQIVLNGTTLYTNS